MVIAQFGEPLLDLYKATDVHIQTYANQKDALIVAYNSLLLLNKIFYSLSSQDIPAYFEDHLGEFMNILSKYLVFRNPLLSSASEDDPSIVEKVQTSICEIVYLYCLRYEEEFVMLPKLVEQLLQLLSTTSMAPKYDLLISMALSVITVVAKRPQNSSLFDTPETLTVIAEKIVLPNIQLRDSDEEQFNEEPLEFVRHDIEGPETESRRRAAEDLIRSLVLVHSSRIIPILSKYIDSCMHVSFC